MFQKYFQQIETTQQILSAELFLSVGELKLTLFYLILPNYCLNENYFI